MRRFLIILFGFVLGGFLIGNPAQVTAQETDSGVVENKQPFDAIAQSEEGEIITFVGRKVFVREDENWTNFQKSDKPNENGEYDYLLRGSRNQARYEILHIVSGDHAGDLIDFYTHDTVAQFSENDHVLFFLKLKKDQETNIRYDYGFYKVQRTQDGDWAACGDVYSHYDTDHPRYAREPLEPITFLEPVIVNVPSLREHISDIFDEDEIISDTDRAETQTEIDEYYEFESGLYRPPIWKRDGDTATCQLGTRVQDLYEFQNQTRFLPDKREDICEARHAEELKALGDDYDAKRTLRKDCKALLKIQNLP